MYPHASRPKGIHLPIVGGPTLPAFSAIKYWLDAGTVAGVADGATIAPANLVDRSASAHGALATATNVVYRTNGGNGRPAIETDGNTSVAVSQALSIPVAGRRVFLVMSQVGTAPGQRFFIDGGALYEGALFSQPYNSVFSGYGVNDIGNVQSSWLAVDPDRMELIDMIYNGASSSLQVTGEVVETGNYSKFTTYSAITLGAPGNLLAGYFGACRIAELIVCDGSLTTAQADTIKAYLYSKHGLVTRKMLVCGGNSLTYGTNSVNPIGGYPSQIGALLAGGVGGWRIINNGDAGKTTQQLDAAAPAFTDHELNWHNRSVHVFFEVINDIIVNSLSGSAAYANLVTYFNNRRAASPGAKLVVCTAFSVKIAGFLTTAGETARVAANSLIRANWATFADGFVDLDADARLSDPTNATYRSADQIHCIDAGYGVMSSLIQPVIDAFG